MQNPKHAAKAKILQELMDWAGKGHAKAMKARHAPAAPAMPPPPAPSADPSILGTPPGAEGEHPQDSLAGLDEETLKHLLGH